MTSPTAHQLDLEPAAEPAPVARAGGGRPWWRVALVGAGLVLVGRVLWGASWSRTGALLGQVGPALLLVPLPFLVGMSLDTLAWRRILRAIGATVPYLRLLRMRLAAESLAITAPAGAVAAEGAKIWFLGREQRISPSRAAASVAIKKVLYLVAHGLYLVLGLVLGQAAIQKLGGGGWAAALYAAAALGLLGGGLLLARSWRRGEPGQFWWALAGRLPWPRLQRWLRARAEGARTFDHSARAFFLEGPRTSAPVVGLLLLQWLTDAAETWLALRFLGVAIDPAPVVAFEALNSVVRSMAFFLPAGVGVQELVQLCFVRSLGLADAAAVTAALVVIKRGKDLLWTLIGFALAGRSGRPA